MDLSKKILSYLLVIVIFGLATAANLPAESVTSCHCFKDRTYNPSKKFAADGYILATSFNSLLAEYFGISKRQIIQHKMQGGVDQDDLLIGLTISKASRVTLKHLLDLRKSKKSWPQILEDPIFSGYHQTPALKGLKSGTPAFQAAAQIADVLISLFFKTPRETVEKFRANGFTEKEITLLILLTSTSDIAPEKIAAQHSKEGKSWSEIAHSLGVEPASAGKLISNYTRK